MLLEKIKLEDDETVLLTVRRHWFVFASRITGVVLTALAPFTVLAVASFLDQTTDMVNILFSRFQHQFWFASALWLLINWMMLAYIWTDHYLDIWIVTSRRIIAVDQVSLFHRSIGSFRLERLQDINIEINGFLATLLDFGEVEAQTASDGEHEFKVIGMPKPREIKSLILEAADARMQSMSTANQNGASEGI